ncbi:unnamed protein product [Pylaiella littoralis]
MHLSKLLVPIFSVGFVGAQTCDGVQKGDFCCKMECGEECGGVGCSSRGEGLTADDCCTANIRAANKPCGSAPCLLNADGMPSPTPSPNPSPTPVTPSPNPSPTPVMTIDTDCPPSSSRPSFRYAKSSGVSGRMYAEGQGCFTMTDLYNFRGEEKTGESKGPIYVLDGTSKVDVPGGKFTNKWLLEAELYIVDGAVFYCKGSGAGGDCDELRIESTGPNAFHEVRGHGGSLYFEDTIVTSWDTPNGKPQEEFEGGRSFLNCVSEKLSTDTCEGTAKNNAGECRMDIIDSEIAYLGYFDAESYGMTWKVRGFCKDLSNPEVFETTNVYGDIKGCNIHHNYYGHYTYGHQGGVWDSNEMHDNHQYGFDPHDDSDYLTISNNLVYNNVNHGIIASKRCNNVKIFGNIVRDGGAQAAGIFLHRSSDGAEVYDNVVENMQDAGIAMLESFDAAISNNTIIGAKYGIRMSLGSADNSVFNNVFEDISQYGLYTYQGSDAPDVSIGRPSRNTFMANLINKCDIGVKIKEGDDNVFTDNTFVSTNTFEFPDSTNTFWEDNDLGGGCIEADDVDELDFAPGSTPIPVC